MKKLILTLALCLASFEASAQIQLSLRRLYVDTVRSLTPSQSVFIDDTTLSYLYHVMGATKDSSVSALGGHFRGLLVDANLSVGGSAVVTGAGTFGGAGLFAANVGIGTSAANRDVNVPAGSFYLTVHGTATGDDGAIRFGNEVDGSWWTVGSDGGNSDRFSIARSGALGSGDKFYITTAGAATIDGSLTVTGAGTIGGAFTAGGSGTGANHIFYMDATIPHTFTWQRIGSSQKLQVNQTTSLISLLSTAKTFALGTSDAQETHLYTNNTLGLRIDASQNAYITGAVTAGGRSTITATGGAAYPNSILNLVSSSSYGGLSINAPTGENAFIELLQNGTKRAGFEIQNSTTSAIIGATAASGWTNTFPATSNSFTGAGTFGGLLSTSIGTSRPFTLTRTGASARQIGIELSATTWGLYDDTNSRYALQFSGSGNNDATFPGALTASGALTLLGATSHISTQGFTLTLDSDGEDWDLSAFAGGSARFLIAKGASEYFSIRASDGLVTLTGDIAVNGGDITTDDDLTVTPAGGDVVLASTLTVNTAGGNVSWGTYTPTLTDVQNLDSTQTYTAQYMRVGNTVTVSGKLDFNPTTNSAAVLVGISLPISSSFTTDEDGAGSGGGTSSAIETQASFLYADATNDRMELKYRGPTTSNFSTYYTFTYQVK